MPVPAHVMKNQEHKLQGGICISESCVTWDRVFTVLGPVVTFVHPDGRRGILKSSAVINGGSFQTGMISKKGNRGNDRK